MVLISVQHWIEIQNYIQNISDKGSILFQFLEKITHPIIEQTSFYYRANIIRPISLYETFPIFVVFDGSKYS